MRASGYEVYGGLWAEKLGVDEPAGVIDNDIPDASSGRSLYATERPYGTGHRSLYATEERAYGTGRNMNYF